MATISQYKTGTTHVAKSGNVTQPYIVSKVINLATAATAKGSALAQADVIEALYIPAGSTVLFAGLQKTAAMTGTSTDLTFDFGITGGDVDCWVDGWDFDAATVGAYGPAAAAAITPANTFFSTADTLDILFATQTGTVLTGKVRAFAVVQDVSNGRIDVGVAAIGS